ncbi:MAG: Crp/Fnr family transcriptional regulator [Chthoniobacterales bacterium]
MPSIAKDFSQPLAFKTLRSCRLFSGVPIPEIEEIASFSIFKKLRKNDYLFHEGAPSEGFYVVQQGAINLHRVSTTGKEQIMHIFRSGESFAEGVLASEDGYPVAACAIESSNVLLLPKAKFLAILRKQPELAIRMLGSMEQHLRTLVSLIENLTLKDVETRLASWLLKHCPHQHSDSPVAIQLQHTKRVLAAELGTVSETLSRTFAKFRDRELIRVAGKSITVLAPAKLNQLLNRNFGEA